MAEEPALKAVIDFDCIDCGQTVQFNLMTLKENKGQLSCEHCHRLYKFGKDFLAKLEKLRRLVLSVQDAEDILGNIQVAVTVPGGEVKVPYKLLLTRLNTLITLRVGDREIDFNFRIEPLNDGAFK